MNSNMLSVRGSEDAVSKVLSILGKPARIRILMVIREQEACVCHLETVLEMRQASISQHLMVLRRAGVVSTNRDGRNIFYRLNQPSLVDLVEQAARISGADLESLRLLSRRPVQGCICPQCSPDLAAPSPCRPAAARSQQ